MISPKKIHQWMLKALEEPFFRAEMHKVEMLLQESKKQKEPTGTGKSVRVKSNHDINGKEKKAVRRDRKKKLL